MYNFRKNNIEDITEYEFKSYIEPHIDRFKNYVQEYALADICAFYIFSGYQMEALYENSLDIFIKDVLSMMNEEYALTLDLKNDTKKILEDKYGLTINSEDPLSFKELVDSNI